MSTARRRLLRRRNGPARLDPSVQLAIAEEVQKQLDATPKRKLEKRFEPMVKREVGKQVEPAIKKQLARTRAPSGTGWTFNSDGLATRHLSPFLEDEAFESLYAEMARDWFPKKARAVDVRWRMWLLIALLRECESLPGKVAEFGTYRAGAAFMILGLTQVPYIYLFDTFTGVPHEKLTDDERQRGFGGNLSDTSVEYVDRRLSRWAPRYEICAGDVFDVLPEVETGPLSFAHMDLNASAPTGFALEYAYPRLLPGAMMVFDDYGFSNYGDQRAVIDRFFADRAESVVALPTGQALMVKR